VTTACNEVEALNAIGVATHYRRRPDFDLVITDVPGGHGPRLGAALGAPKRCVPMLPISGLRREPEAEWRRVELDDFVELATTIAQHGRLGRA
jgi:hypothetical protein